MQRAIDAIKANLLSLPRTQVIGSGGIEDSDVDEDGEGDSQGLSDEQVNYLLTLINSPDVEEPDAELVLSLLRDHGEEVLPRMVHVLRRFPGLTKSIYNYARFAADRDGLDDLILGFLKDSPLPNTNYSGLPSWPRISYSSPPSSERYSLAPSSTQIPQSFLVPRSWRSRTRDSVFQSSVKSGCEVEDQTGRPGPLPRDCEQ